MPPSDFEREFKGRLKGANKIVVMAVGDELDPRDCLGYLAGKKIASLDLKGIEVLITEQMPENFTSEVRRLGPSHVVLIDATEMGKKPGELAFIDSGQIVATRVSTHALPLSAVMDYLRGELHVEASLIGIQPAEASDVGGGRQPSNVQRGIDRIAHAFKEIAATVAGGPVRK